MRYLICVVLATFVQVAWAQPAGPARGAITLRSASPELDAGFAWARARALSLVRTGQQPDYVPCYFAAMSDREFCVRDTAHMAEGAHLLGLDAENWSMLRAFAWGANRRVKQDLHWPRWHYPYTGGASDDLGSCQWRTLPTPYDMAWRAWQQYLWTGDRRWVDDPEMVSYHTNLHGAFTANQNWNDDPVADEMQQLASYFEFPAAGEHFVSAGDAVGCQYQALLATAGLMAARGDDKQAGAYRQKATELRAWFETNWFDPATGHYVRGVDRFGGFRSDWGRENSYFMPLTLITDQGPHTAAYLDFIEASLIRDPLNIEATTYLPELFYQHGRTETAWKSLMSVYRTRHGYPEVAFTCVGNTIAGLMGVTPDAPRHALATLAQLPAELPWVEAEQVPVGANHLALRHDGNRRSTLRNTAGPALTWTARFRGNFASLSVAGRAQAAKATTHNGFTITAATVTVAPGQSVTVEVVGGPGVELPAPPSPTLTEGPRPPAPTPGSHSLTELTPRYARSATGEPVQSDKGQPLHLGALTAEHGLVARGVSAIRFDLHGQYARFVCDVGYENPAEARGAAEFVIHGGTRAGRLLYASGPLAGKARLGVRHISLDVSACDYLILGAKDAGGGGFDDRIVWGNPRLLAKGGTLASRPPAAPQGLKTARLDHSSVDLAWPAVPGAAGYDIYQGELSVGSSTQPSLRVDGLSPNQKYTFTVKAWDADGNVSVAGAPLSVSTPLPPDLVYLSDLTWASAVASFGTTQRDRSIDSHPLRLRGTLHERGLGTHATSTIVYDLAALGRGYDRFQASVGIDDEIREAGSVVFQVFVDGEKRYDSGVVTSATAAQAVSVAVRGAKELKLVVTDGGDGISSDHADWASARLTNGGG